MTDANGDTPKTESGENEDVDLDISEEVTPDINVEAKAVLRVDKINHSVDTS